MFSACLSSPNSGKKKEPKPKHFGPDIFGWGGVLPGEGGGGQKVQFVLRSPGKPNFLAGCLRIFAGMSQGRPKSFSERKKKKYVFNSSAGTLWGYGLVAYGRPFPGSEKCISESLSAYYLCVKANSPSFSQNSPSFPQNSVSSRFRNSTFETVFHPFPKIPQIAKMGSPK